VGRPSIAAAHLGFLARLGTAAVSTQQPSSARVQQPLSLFLVSLTSGSRVSVLPPFSRNRAGVEQSSNRLHRAIRETWDVIQLITTGCFKREPLLFSISFSYLRVPICPSWRLRLAEAWVPPSWGIIKFVVALW
jgi:hypothetical protein